VMEDIEVPVVPEPQRDPYGLYQRGPQSYAPEPPPPAQEPETGPENSYAPEQPAPAEESAPPAMAYTPVVPYVAAVPYVPPVVVVPCPPVFPYGGIWVGPRVGVFYGPRAYLGAPVVRPYAPRAYAPAVRGYGYGYTGRGMVAGGFTSRGTMMAARGGVGFRARR
jgi:hypothetical protein